MGRKEDRGKSWVVRIWWELGDQVSTEREENPECYWFFNFVSSLIVLCHVWLYLPPFPTPFRATPRSLPIQLCVLFSEFIIYILLSSSSPICAAHRVADVGTDCSMVYFPGYTFRENGLSLSQQRSAASGSSAGSRTWVLLPFPSLILSDFSLLGPCACCHKLWVGHVPLDSENIFFMLSSTTSALTLFLSPLPLWSLSHGGRGCDIDAPFRTKHSIIFLCTVTGCGCLC